MILEIRANNHKEVLEQLEKYGNKKVSVEIKPLRITHKQRKSLHLLFSQLSDLCLEHGITMNMIVKKGFEIPCTKENLKMLWKLMQKSMFGDLSTNDLKRTGQIDQLYDAFNALMIERTNGQISLPPWPCIDELINNNRQEYGN